MKIHLERYGERGWQFTISGADGLRDGTEYRTNRKGEGLWMYSETSGWYPDTGKAVWEFRQIEGTCQFALSPDRKRAYGQIRYRWTAHDQ